MSLLRVSDILYVKQDDIREIFKQHCVEEVRIFGSVYRQEDGVNSDVDFLIKMSSNSTLFQGLITLRDAMFMNVDYTLLANTIFEDLNDFKVGIQEYLNRL